MPDGGTVGTAALQQSESSSFASDEGPVRLYLDIETRSAVNLIAKGVYVYAESPSTQIILLSYATNDGPIKTWYILLEPQIPEDLRAAILDPRTTFVAHNAGFERVLLTVVGRRFLERAVYEALKTVSRWTCTAARSALMGLPRSLDNASRALGVPIKKDGEGHALMLDMCVPRGLDSAGGYIWIQDLFSQLRLGAYCETDVAVERLIDKDVPQFSKFEHEVWATTERMNDRGISVDPLLLHKLILFAGDAEAAASDKIFLLTEGAVPKVTNVLALRRWVVAQGLEEADELDEHGKPNGVGKWMLQRWLEDDSLPPLLREVLVVRKEGGKSSPKKFIAIAGRLNLDNRIRGSLLYCGAASTSRFSSRGAQLQNLPRGVTVKDMMGAIADIMADVSIDEIRVHGPPLVVASEMARPVFIASPRHWLARGDYSQIEARVLAWIAGETTKVQAFRDYDTILPGQFDGKGKPLRKGPDLYTFAAALIFQLAMADILSNQRQVGKVSELACGYQGGIAALKAMGRLYNISMTDEQWDAIKVRWRASNPAIVQFWYDLNTMALRCMAAKPGDRFHVRTGLWFKRNNRALALRVPGGGALIYWYPEVVKVDTPWGDKRDTVTFMADDSQKHIWVRHKGYGGLFCENVCQKIARDIMADALVRMDAAGLDPRLTVHDEAVCQIPWSVAPHAEDAARLVEEMMMIQPSWSRGLPVAADSSAHQRYWKG